MVAVGAGAEAEEVAAGGLGQTRDLLAVLRDLVLGIGRCLVLARAAQEPVGPRPAHEDVVAGASVQDVVARVAEQPVVAGLAVDRVGLLRPLEDVVLRRPDDRRRRDGRDNNQTNDGREAKGAHAEHERNATRVLATRTRMQGRFR
jgi:hypothetical protein